MSIYSSGSNGNMIISGMSVDYSYSTEWGSNESMLFRKLSKYRIYRSRKL